MRRRLLPLLLLICALPAAAQIYKYTDANGNTAYSNQPPDGKASQTVELPPLNSIGPHQPPALPPGQEPSNQATSVAPYNALELTDVPDGAAALRANNGTFTVGVRIEPRLQNGHRLRLVLDGNAYGQPSNVPRLQLVNVDRGEHNLSVQVLDGERVVQQSPTVTFTVQRVHKP